MTESNWWRGAVIYQIYPRSFLDTNGDAVLPTDKMGVYMGIFNFFMVIPQLPAASVPGFLLKTFFGNVPINALLIGGASLIVAGLFTLRVRETWYERW